MGATTSGQITELSEPSATPSFTETFGFATTFAAKLGTVQN